MKTLRLLLSLGLFITLVNTCSFALEDPIAPAATPAAQEEKKSGIEKIGEGIGDCAGAVWDGICTGTRATICWAGYACEKIGGFFSDGRKDAKKDRDNNEN